MLDDLYSDALLDAAANVPPRQQLTDADATARRTSKVCGSEITVSLKMAKGVVVDIGLDVKACALGQAAASIFARAVRGATPADLRRVRDEMWAMLREGVPVPQGERWAELVKLQPIKDYPARHKSTMLVFEAAVDCVDQIEQRQSE